MFAFLPKPILIFIVFFCYAVLTLLIIPIPLLGMGVLYYLLPIKSWRRFCDKGMQEIGKWWGDISNAILWLFTKIEWEIKGLERLSSKKSYLIIANHQSWADIIVLQKVFNRQTPLSRYFIKEKLIHVPFIGWCCRLLHFPYMKRYSRALLEKYPELKGKDIETTRKACKHFKEFPVALINFVEGTRFTRTKQKILQSPYQHLLPPRAGGSAFALAAIGEYLDAILNTTIIYGITSPTIVDFFTGKVKKITVQVQLLPITPELIGDYQNDPQFKKKFQGWINALWSEKDHLLRQLL